MLQNARITAFTVSDLLRENQQRVKLPTQTRIKSFKSGISESLLAIHKTSSLMFEYDENLRDTHSSETYLKPSRTSTMELFCENVKLFCKKAPS